MKFTTVSGRTIDPLDLWVRDVDVRDIATALSNLCRYAGHTEQFYSVAEHSVLVAEVALGRLPREADHETRRLYTFCALMHDAHEAYLGDVVGPLKAHGVTIGGRPLEDLEADIDNAIRARYRVPQPPQEAVDTIRKIDGEVLLYEQRWLRCIDSAQHVDHVREGSDHSPGYGPGIRCLKPKHARGAFLRVFNACCM